MKILDITPPESELEYLVIKTNSGRVYGISIDREAGEEVVSITELLEEESNG